MKLTEITKINKKRMSYNKNILDGIDEIDRITCYELMKSIIPASIRTSSTPYLPIRRLINFFDPKQGARRQMAGGAGRFCDCLIAHENLKLALDKINRLDNELVRILYLQRHDYSASELVFEVKKRINDILTLTRQFMVDLQNSGLTYRFVDSEIIHGSKDGKRPGLLGILFKANTNMEELVNFIDKVEKITKKGKNPLSYFI